MYLGICPWVDHSKCKNPEYRTGRASSNSVYQLKYRFKIFHHNSTQKTGDANENRYNFHGQIGIGIIVLVQIHWSDIVIVCNSRQRIHGCRYSAQRGTEYT